tara:strand:- start:82 stop:783 length:702 start_codon:yes stop_codon:yes gene_type:complete
MEQINSRGQALEEGLDVFISVPFLSNEYLSFNDSFIASTLSTTNIITSTSAYATEAVSSAGLPSYSNSNWYRFSSNSEAIPSSLDNAITLPVIASGGVGSILGVFQELKQLVKGNEYTITINFHNFTGSGTLGVSRLYNSIQPPYSLVQSSVSEYILPTGSVTLDFKAYGTSDILFIEFTSILNISASISSISVKEKNNYLMPVVTNLIGSGIAKVLKRKYNTSIPLEEGERA